MVLNSVQWWRNSSMVFFISTDGEIVCLLRSSINKEWKRTHNFCILVTVRGAKRFVPLLMLTCNLTCNTTMCSAESTRMVSISLMLLDHMLLSSKGQETCFFEIAAIVLSMKNIGIKHAFINRIRY
ncbi:hypothetical protein BRADI_4g04945v3 [Brachypodium distachyon]|uniref:Uncharacterized protein n=1 Tax=Brachypodium distachyon TaxID=15368 RepID=A0A0Q3L1P8_BRADI|nr:hypothetical protein BRADI_4g04945v3 [Brachypodium distachyon]KQJ86365.1 hypothetical protein BRADI_4g04945v3 [Brachypodium distachyon]